MKFTEIFNDEHINILQRQLLFSGLSEREIYLFIIHSQPMYKRLAAGQSLRIAEFYGHMIGLVLTGSAYVYSIELDGNKTLLSPLEDGAGSSILYGMFDYSNALIEFTAAQDSEILIIDPISLFIGEESLALIQQKILVNMIASQRQSFLKMAEHMACLAQRNIKSKVLRFLKTESERKGSNEFLIPFSREELANYLAVDRAALSRVLGELKRDGIIDFRKNKFTLISC